MKVFANFSSIILACIAFIFESIILFSYLTNVFNLFFLILFHVCILTFLLFFVFRASRREEDLRYPLLLLLAAFGAGPFGIAGFLLEILLRPLFSKFSTPMDAWLEGLFPEEQINPFTKIFQRIKFKWDDYGGLSEVVSFQDLFTYGNLSKKQTVLDAIVKDFHPIYSPILQLALQDSHNTVRIQAAAIVTKIEHDFDQEIMKLVARHKEDPKNSAIILQLAIGYDTYASLGILDSLRKKEVSRQAVHFYREYLMSHPNDRNTSLSIGRLLFHMQDFDHYLSWCKEFCEKDKHFPEIFRTWRLEALYKLQRYEELSTESKGF